MRAVVVVLAVVLGLVSRAGAKPKATFDLMSYDAPAGFKSAPANGGLSLQAIDEKQATFAMIVVAPSTASAGSLDKDFQAAWASAIVPTFGVTDAPAMTPGSPEGGWDATSGAAKATVQGMPATVLLVVMTGHGKTMSIIIAMNSDTYMTAIGSFLSSVKLAKPAAAAAPPVPAPAAPPTGGGPTTTFDDGWTSRAEASWVRVTRDGATVLLHYPNDYTDASRADPAGYFWQQLVAPRYAVTKLYRTEYSAMSFPYYFLTADAVDNATKQPVFVALRVVSISGVAFAIEVVTASQAAFGKVFPDQDKLAAIVGANRFAIGGEVAGTWSGLSGSSASLYNASTGGYAGMSTITMSDVFTFGPKGAYASQHQGANTTAGNTSAYSVKKKGTYAVAPWEMTVKLSDGTTQVFSAYYEMTRGGRLLHIQDKKYSGINYTLKRDK